ncbi:hypothetical protein EZS27_007745 [termite gut metagenome]|uniref:Uncharacterized protein n=1 Tax=termite gut metagenome TaxID=433724 RepID=A0A5J4SH24_9ZZZZ
MVKNIFISLDELKKTIELINKLNYNKEKEEKERCRLILIKIKNEFSLLLRVLGNYSKYDDFHKCTLFENDEEIRINDDFILYNIEWREQVYFIEKPICVTYKKIINIEEYPLNFRISDFIETLPLDIIYQIYEITYNECIKRLEETTKSE